MKHCLYLLLFGTLLFACKKDKKEPESESPAPQTGNITIKIQSYDSLGQLRTEHGGFKVKIDATQSATTDVNGTVQFNGMDYGSYFPNLLSSNFESPPVMVTLNQSALTATVPAAQRSPYKVSNFTGQIIKKDSIIIDFKLDKPIPAGKSVQVALITGTNSSLSASNYLVSDAFFTNSNSVSKLNIAKFARFKNLVAGLDSSAIFFVNVVPVSYGEYESNLLLKPLLLGDNLFAPDNWLFKKEWK